MKTTVIYRGFLQQIRREFPTMARAKQWARQVGVFDRATFVPTNKEKLAKV